MEQSASFTPRCLHPSSLDRWLQARVKVGGNLKKLGIYVSLTVETLFYLNEKKNMNIDWMLYIVLLNTLHCCPPQTNQLFRCHLRKTRPGPRLWAAVCPCHLHQSSCQPGALWTQLPAVGQRGLPSGWYCLPSKISLVQWFFTQPLWNIGIVCNLIEK